MGFFTAIGSALGFSAVAAAGASVSAATAVGIGVSAIAAGAVTAAYAGSGGFSSKKSSGDARIAAAIGTGGLSELEAQTASKRRAFRSGVLFTSPTGLDSDPRTSSAKLR